MNSVSSTVSSSPPSSPASDTTTSPIDIQRGEANDSPHEDGIEYYISDTSKVKASDRNRFILGACYGVVPDFTLKTGPYEALKKGQMPTQAMLKTEVLRRDPSFKQLRKKKNDELILILEDLGSKVSAVDFAFITDSEIMIRDIMNTKEKEKEIMEENSRGPNISNSDRLRY